MAENKQDNSLNNLKVIENFRSKKAALLQSIAGQRKFLDDAKAAIDAKRLQLEAELEERLAREEAKVQSEKEKEEVIKKESAAPIIEVPEQASEPEVEEEPEVKEVKAEPEADVVQSEPIAAKPVEAKPEEPAKPVVDSREAARAKVTSALFAKPKKPVVEKPVIRVYIPPVEEPRRRYNNDNRPQNNQQGAPRYNQNNTDNRAGTLARAANAPMPVNKNAPTDKKKPSSVDRPEDKTRANKKAMTKKGYVSDNAVIEYDETTGEVKKIRTRKTGAQKKDFNLTETAVIEHAILTKDTFTVKELSEKIGKSGTEIIKKLFLLGIMKTINDVIDFDTAELVAGDLGITLELQREETSEEKLLSYYVDESDDPATLVARPPIVTVMGHVDHGKTSILDSIKKTNVAAGEAGGITQHVSAYTISVKGQHISFLDTPGHAAFTAMRARGANATDIVVIVIAADDGIMPQTVEVINHSKAAGVKIIVAINKCDKPAADPERVMTQMTEYGLVPEEWGGEVPVVKVSAKTGENIDLLLDTILIVAEIMELKANPNRLARGIIVEARLDKGKGPLATVLVQNGTLKVGDHIVAGTVTGKVRGMSDDKGRVVKKAGPSMAVSILGLSDVPNAGDQLMAVENEKLLKSVVAERIARDKQSMMSGGKVTLDDVFREIAEGKLKSLNLIIKADVQGSVEALKESLLKLSNDEVRVNVVHAMAGAINEGDVALADTTRSIIIGFNVRPDAPAKNLAEAKKIDIRLYRVIYDAIDDVSSAIKGLLAPKFREQYLGRAEVRVIYKISGIGTIAGCMVKDGKIVKNAKVRLIRDNVVIADTSILSLKRMKDDVKEVATNFECGIGLDNFNDIKEYDIIESFNIVEDKD